MGDDLRRSSAHVDAAGGRGAAGRRMPARAGLDDSFEGDSGDYEDGGGVWGKRAPLESPTMSSTPAASYKGFGGGGGGKAAGRSMGESLLLIHDTNQVGVDRAVVDVCSYSHEKIRPS